MILTYSHDTLHLIIAFQSSRQHRHNLIALQKKLENYIEFMDTFTPCPCQRKQPNFAFLSQPPDHTAKPHCIERTKKYNNIK